jgi:hypothetical protein
MSIRLRLGDESFDIPTVGDANWGEQVTLYLEKLTEIIATIQGPQDILLTSAPLTKGSSSQPINGLSFDTSTVQQVIVEGLITREFKAITGRNPTVDSFICNGVYDKDDFYIDFVPTGTDTEVELDVNAAGQFVYTDNASVSDIDDTLNIIIKFRAKAILDE